MKKRLKSMNEMINHFEEGKKAFKKHSHSNIEIVDQEAISFDQDEEGAAVNILKHGLKDS